MLIASQTASLTRTILHQTWPILLSQLAVGAFGVIDVMLISHLSAQHSAAVGVGTNIFNTVSIGFIATLFILPPSISKLYAEKNDVEMAHIICQGIYLALLLSVPICILLCFPDLLIRISQLSTTTEAITRQYLLGLAGAIPALMLFRVFYAYTSGTLRPQRIMKFNLVGLLVKLPLAWIFVFGVGNWQGLGALGCSLSSMFILWGQISVAGWSVYNDHEHNSHLIFLNWVKPHWAKLWILLKNGLPIGAGVFVDYTAHTTIGLFVARLSDVVMAGHQIASNIAYMAYLIPLALSVSVTVLLSYAMGKADKKLAHQTTLTAVKLSASIALFVSLILLFGHHILASLYTNNPVVLRIAAKLLIVASIYHFFDALVTLFLGILRAHNKTLVPAFLLGTTLWTFGLCGGYYLAFYYQGGLGVIGFWIAIAGAEALSALLIGFYAWQIAHRIFREENYQTN